MSNVPMSTVSLELSAEEFITSETAKLVFSATVALTDPSIDARAEVLKAASQIADGDWYITSVTRSEDTSGIETVNYTLSVRVSEKIVAGVKTKVSSVNRAGLKFVLTQTDYTPTAKQIEEGNKSLRAKIYAKAVEEMTVLQTATGSGPSDDGWVIGDIQFNSAPAFAKTSNVRGNAMYATAFHESAGGGAPEEDQGITQKLTLNASVQFARKIYNRL